MYFVAGTALGYADESAYQVMERLFAENFATEEKLLRPKANTELTSDSLQSLDDLEASYRVKGKQHYKGYVANITETCDPKMNCNWSPRCRWSQ